MNSIISGIIILCLGVWGMATWWGSFGLVMRGLVPFGLLSLGVLAVASGFRKMTEGPSRHSSDDEKPRRYDLD